MEGITLSLSAFRPPRPHALSSTPRESSQVQERFAHRSLILGPSVDNTHGARDSEVNPFVGYHRTHTEFWES